ncbi:MAG: hypothetical protein ACJ8DI_06395 [Ktedonobacteraceae bacterium]
MRVSPVMDQTSWTIFCTPRGPQHLKQRTNELSGVAFHRRGDEAST